MGRGGIYSISRPREGGEIRPGACSPWRLQTVGVSSRAVERCGCEGWCSSGGGRGEENRLLSTAHLVVLAQLLDVARRIQYRDPRLW